MSKRSVLIIVLALAVRLAPAELSADEGKLSAANTKFAFDLLKEIAGEQPKANVFISPFSVSVALQMVANGAAGDTRTEMENALGTSALSPDALNGASKELNRSLNSQTNAILNLADGIWYQEGLRLKPDFAAINRRFFQASLAPVDFKNPNSAKTINDWADERTHGKIKDIVQWPFDPLTRMILANAIYFKGTWARPFEKSATKAGPFYEADGASQSVPMMWQRGRFSYQEGDGFQAVRLPYAGGRLWMNLFLPVTNSSPAKLLSKLTGAAWRDEIERGFMDRDGTVALPRFRLEYQVSLNDSLKALGIRHAFEDADFSAMAAEPLFISQVKQKSYVAVNEQGTEAAAVTTVAMEKALLMRPISPFEMMVDRPFFFVIEDRETQSILFMGLVYRP